jgi:uncharacterized RDD family membrane protein YckC
LTVNTPASNQANPYAPPQAEVRDGVATDQSELAGRGERFGAAMLDGIIVLVAIIGPLLIGADFATITRETFYEAISVVGASLAGLASLALLIATIYLVNKNGQTIGKKIVGIKVVRTDFSRASLGRIFWLRNIVNGIPGAIPVIGNVYGLIDHLFIFFGERRQCVHDKIADTLVVKA